MPRIQVIWVWGHMGIDGSEITNKLDKAAHIHT